MVETKVLGSADTECQWEEIVCKKGQGEKDAEMATWYGQVMTL